MRLKISAIRTVFELVLSAVIIFLLSIDYSRSSQSLGSVDSNPPTAVACDSHREPTVKSAAEQAPRIAIVNGPATQDDRVISAPAPRSANESIDELAKLAAYSEAEEYAAASVGNFEKFLKLSESQKERLRARNREEYFLLRAYGNDSAEYGRRQSLLETDEQILGAEPLQQYMDAVQAEMDDSIRKQTHRQNVVNVLVVSKALQLSAADQQKLLSAMEDPSHLTEGEGLYLSKESGLSADEEADFVALYQRLNDHRDEMLKSIGIDPENFPEKYLEGTFYNTTRMDLDVIRANLGDRLSEDQYQHLYKLMKGD